MERRRLGPGTFERLRRLTKRALTAVTILGAGALPSLDALGQARYVDTTLVPGGFVLADGGHTAALYVDPADWAGVVRATSDLQADIERVTDLVPPLVASAADLEERTVLIGTIGKSALIDRLVAERKIDVSGVEGEWESFFLETVAEPLPGVESALVIAGSDKRGTIYGIYDLSRQIGVSPWYWWADVAPDHEDTLVIRPGRYTEGPPSVKYRGIFLNDERPDLDFWVRHTYGERPEPGNPDATIANFGSAFYARIFEVILRLGGNYLWPAMWNNAFAEDDPVNPALADEYGIVMGTSHQEPMLRAQKEWDWHLGRQQGNWNFATQEDVLTGFWRGAVRERSAFENIYTIGLRGENDTAMIHGEEENIRLLERIVGIQRQILGEEIAADVATIPQVWTLYKEVQGYYEAGLRVPDDVTLLWAEDNWGNVRRLPTAGERGRSGGAGVYYHLDYHGGPRSYQWINTNPIPKIWDQMSLAAAYGADRIWIVNVGHFKGYELPMEYFLDLAWNTERWTHENLREYLRSWSALQFGEELADETAEILEGYTRYNGRRKPELLSPETYSLTSYREWETVVDDYDSLVAKAEAVYSRVPEHKRDAFYQLVLFPTRASAQVNALYFAAARNALYARQGRASTNDLARQVRDLFRADADLMSFFNDTFAEGRWSHFMDQSHIGYTSWRDPPADSLDAIPLDEIDVPEGARLGVAAEGDPRGYPDEASGHPVLPELDAFNRGRSYVDIFNRGRTPFDYTASADADWILLDERLDERDESRGTVEGDRRIWVSLDWERVPAGRSSGTLTIAGAGEEVAIEVRAFNPTEVTPATLEGFVEARGVVSIEPEHFTASRASGSNRWIRIEDYGRTLSGMRAEGPIDGPSATPGIDSSSLEYRMYLFDPGEVSADLILAPTLNFVPGRGLRLAVSFDEEPPQIVEAVPEDYDAQNGNRDWERSVMNNARTVRTRHRIEAPGYHTLKVWMVDPAVLVQKIVVRTDRAPEASTYLGPPESFRR